MPRRTWIERYWDRQRKPPACAVCQDAGIVAAPPLHDNPRIPIRDVIPCPACKKPTGKQA